MVSRWPRYSLAYPGTLRCTNRLECRTELCSENHWLLPCGEVAAFVELVVIDEFGIRLLGPTPRGFILLARKHAHGDGYRDAFRVEKAAFIFPVETRRGDPGVR